MVAWVIFVMISGLGVRLFGLRWDFQTVAELGESFGVLGAIMAGIAVYFTWEALTDERAETTRLRKREADRDDADRLRDLAREARIDEERLRDKELTFFRMLELRREILNDAQVDGHRGIRAFQSLYYGYQKIMKDMDRTDSSESIKFGQKYAEYQQKFSYFLDHYFRFSYHILRFVNESFSYERAYQYVRILRAQLSSAEQFNIALNAIYGAGKDKMLPLINKYGLIHNMPDGDAALILGFNAGLEEGAFASHASEG